MNEKPTPPKPDPNEDKKQSWQQSPQVRTYIGYVILYLSAGTSWRFGEYLNQYYAEVMASIGDADSILIMGPGKAKGELEELLTHEKLSGRIVGIETSDKLTEPQIVAEVRRYFRKK